MRSVGDEVACIVLEPVAGNGGCGSQRGIFAGLAEVCDCYGALLLFDEVITGFRMAYGGAQEYFGVRPDLTTLGKIIGGGLLGLTAAGGICSVAPAGPSTRRAHTPQSIAVSAGIATLNRSNPWLLRAA